MYMQGISAGALIGPRAQIGENVVIGPGVIIGADTVIKSGAVIGEIGFGYDRDQDGRWARKDHHFDVIIGDDVHIGANTCIDSGSWRDTIICAGARIDNQVHVAHNTIIGPNAVVVAQAALGGSVEVGEGAWIGLGAKVLQRLKIGASALVGMGAIVLDDVPDDVTVAGCPARIIDATQGVREEM